MSITAPVVDQKTIKPWNFVPLLYFTQALPPIFIQDVSAIIYKSMGVADKEIIVWTTVLGVPWTLQVLLGPLVDLTNSKRNWTIIGQTLVVIGLLASAAIWHTSQFFNISIALMLITGVFSALCNIATDGYQLLALSREKQAAFSGVQSAFFRLGRLFCAGTLVWIAGMLMTVPPLTATAPPGQDFKFVGGKTAHETNLVIDQGKIVDAKYGVLQPEVEVPAGTQKIELRTDGEIVGSGIYGSKSIGKSDVIGASSKSEGMAMDPATAWTIIFIALAGMMVLSRLILPRVLPRSDGDPVPAINSQEVLKNVGRTVSVVGLGVTGYLVANSLTRIGANFIANYRGNLAGWVLTADALQKEYLQLLWSGLASMLLLWAVIRLIRGTEVESTFSSFLKQDRILSILGFLIFFRFTEAMVGRVTPLFLLGDAKSGGLGVTTAQVGTINGYVGVVGIILGGIVGGFLVAKLGVRRALIPLALGMHLPNLLYVWAASARPIIPAGANGFELVFSPIGFVTFIDQFAYGVGYSAYAVYLMFIARRGNYPTSHFAIATGLGSLLISMAGLTAGVVREYYSASTSPYLHTYIVATMFSIPGILILFFIPKPDEQSAVSEYTAT